MRTTRKPPTIRVLAIDGGGIRGILPVRVLVALEELTGQPTADLFDVLVGTSIGGIGVLGLTRPGSDGRPVWTAQDLHDLYSKRAAEIFPTTSLSWPQSLQQVAEMIRRPTPTAALLGSNPRIGNARYDPAGLNSILQDQLGDTMLSAALKPVVVPAYDVRAQQPVIFATDAVRRGDQPDTTMVSVARATSAAPTYFPPYADLDTAGEERLLVDGGLYANNPALLGYQAAIKRTPSPAKVVLVSLGTGMPGPRASLTHADYMGLSWFRLAQSLLEGAQVGGVALIDDFLRTVIGDTYWRFDVSLADGMSHELDNTSQEHIDWLSNRGLALVGERVGDLHRLAEMLTEVG